MTEHYSTTKDFYHSVKNEIDVPLYIIIQKTDKSSFILLFNARVYYCIDREVNLWIAVKKKNTFYGINCIIYINRQQSEECRLFKNCKFL